MIWRKSDELEYIFGVDGVHFLCCFFFIALIANMAAACEAQDLKAKLFVIEELQKRKEKLRRDMDFIRNGSGNSDLAEQI